MAVSRRKSKDWVSPGLDTSCMSTYLVFLEAKPLTVLVLYKAKREILFSRLQFDSGRVITSE